MLLENFTLLYVEDSIDMQSYMKSLIEDEVKKFYQAYDGEQGLAIYQDKKPDIILSDIRMPKMSGLKMSQTIKELDKHQSILLLSAFESIDTLKEAINISIDGFIVKPIDDFNKLLSKLENIALNLKNKLDAKKAYEQICLSASVFNNSQEGILITDKDNRIVDVNPACLSLTGYSREEIIGQTPTLFSSGTQSSEFYAQMWQSLTDIGHWQGEITNRKKSGEIYSERLSIDCVSDVKGQLQHYVAVFYDITYLKEHEAKLKYIAYNDALTNLPNRLLLQDRMQQAISKVKRDKNLLAICYFDLDGFKPVNDTYGHKAGDTILIEVAKRLQKAIRADDTVARIGGDEFVLLLIVDSKSELKQVLERILVSISTPYLLTDDSNTKTISIDSISASIGLALYPEDESDADILLRYADQAMYKAKQKGKNRYCFFIE